MLTIMATGILLFIGAIHGMSDGQAVNQEYEQALMGALPDCLKNGERPTMTSMPLESPKGVKTEYALCIHNNALRVCGADVTEVRVWFVCPEDASDGHYAIHAYNETFRYRGQYTINGESYAFYSRAGAKKIYDMFVKAAIK